MVLSEEKIQNLDLAISDLETSSAAIKGYTKIFKELSSLQSLVNKDRIALEATSKSLENISDLIDEQFTDYKDITIQLITDTGVELSDKLENLVNNATNEINQAFSILQSVSSTIDDQTSQSKSFFREIDSTLITRLDKHKSDITLDLRNEGALIQRALETSLNSRVSNLESILLNEIEKQRKAIKNQSVLIIVLAATALAGLAAPYLSNL